MTQLKLAFLGDIVGSPGRRAAIHAAKTLRGDGVDLIVANGENARHGSGLSADNARALLRSDINALTLGDHCFRDRSILPLLREESQPISRPANLAAGAPGKTIVRIEHAGVPPIYVITVLGRLFMPTPPDNPFAAIDRELAAISEPGAIVLVEIHAEATSEKNAMAWHCLENWTGPDRPAVVLVVGTHTHVPTADARIIDRRMAAMTDAGMTGPQRSVIGRSVSAVLSAMVDQKPTPLDVATDDVRAQGCVVSIDCDRRRAVSIQAIDIAAPE